VAALQARGRFGIRLGLARVRALLRALGEPHRDLPGALVAGTNGKGSVQAIVASVLRAAGRRVGQTPSPHLVTYRERVLVDGRPIAPADFAELVERVLAAEAGLAHRHGHATEFELLTAAAFAWFQEARVDVGAIEVGMGGRLDATNAWDGGVAAISNVDWDHVGILGPTLEAIAREKAAIIKPGDRAVTGADGPGLTVVRARCRALGVPLREATVPGVANMDRSGLGLRVPELGPLHLSLLGRHQAANAGVALGILADLEAAGIAAVDETQIRQGFATVRWPGRLELLAIGDDGRAGRAQTAAPTPGSPDLLLDGAHNVAGIASLVAAVEELRPLLSDGRPTALLGILADKDVAGVAEALLAADWVDGARIITTRVAMPRALPAVELADALRVAAAGRSGPAPRVEAIDLLPEALGAAMSTAREEGGPLIVCGSLYLVGEVRGRLLDDPDLRDPAA
jgi:dihydrofolate synthase/folylpolyglutamate synthase